MNEVPYIPVGVDPGLGALDCPRCHTTGAIERNHEPAWACDWCDGRGFLSADDSTANAAKELIHDLDDRGYAALTLRDTPHEDRRPGQIAAMAIETVLRADFDTGTDTETYTLVCAVAREAALIASVSIVDVLCECYRHTQGVVS